MAEVHANVGIHMEGSRLVVAHTHNDGDALIKHPRKSFK